MMQKKRVNIISLIIVCAFLFLLKTVQGEGDSLSSDGVRGDTKIEYKSENLRDPFEPEKIEVEKIKEEEGLAQSQVQIPVEIKPLPSLEIQGIVWGSALPLAIINHKVLKIGDTIEEARITDISKGKVSIIFYNQEYNLSVSQPINPSGPDKMSQGGKYER